MTTEAIPATPRAFVALPYAAAIDGQPTSVEAAIATAAGLLGRSRNAVIAGLGTDADGARACIGLARTIGGSIDHMHGEATLRNLEVMRQAGWIVTTPLQTRARADVVLLIGPGLAATWPDLPARLALDVPPSLGIGQKRTVLRLGTSDAGAAGSDMLDNQPDLPWILAALRAVVAGRPIRAETALSDALHRCATQLAEARFGVAVWSADHLDQPGIEMLCGLVDDLNRTTRFAGLPLASGDNAQGVLAVAAAQTGFPLRLGLTSDAAIHDPWRFDAVRMVDSGEADAAAWISSLSAAAPSWRRAIPTVALVASGTRFATPPSVALTVGRPGIDHPGVLFDPALGTIAFAPASAATDAPRVADLLARINAQVVAPATTS